MKVNAHGRRSRLAKGYQRKAPNKREHWLRQAGLYVVHLVAQGTGVCLRPATPKTANC